MTSHSGILHEYTFKKVAFQFDLNPNPTKILVFIGGLTDGLLTVPYVPKLAQRLKDELTWTTFQIQFTSSFNNWGISNLTNDINDIEKLIKYLREKYSPSKIVIMGHSTGSQDVIHYLLNKQTKTPVDAGIMQASVSDRSSFNINATEKGRELNEIAIKLCEEGRQDELLSYEHMKMSWNTPITAFRWNSLMNKGGQDDYFSDDLTMEELKFSEIQVPFLMVFSGSDEFIPKSVDKNKLLAKWKENSNKEFWSKHSGLIPGASHNVKEINLQDSLCSMVINFIKEFNL
ncbi:related to UPF0613 protein PB24D3.06c [Saccharomycodes ludwigii]|uniref:Related to UPF0613 protein PB24D3.06c n=1 Tax=Saccharomycodes ludwigii TaxID=36035 RepID=A0A376B314_9ASCO|nr:hypothetical protein SCDLUD_002143 [Saccharomycodes ludwigii]KAH3902323.1 hypothetical protein SCDLUD_002143 [Saccharomycodes ludwigii]SSD58520.1 related to UPF0613 protein PB24D3.06c [Saccharomycodes ludwigii]